MPRRQVRYAVVGLGHIAQVAVLPAFGNARRNSKLAALVSGDPVKREQLSRQYKVDKACSYEQYDEMLKSGDVDAVYIALPNSLHCEYAVRAAQAGVHVLVEKPMALTEEECERMARAARDAHVKLMVAYRLHFERANLEAIEVARSGRIGEPRLFNSTFTMHVVPGTIRVKSALGGVKRVIKGAASTVAVRKDAASARTAVPARAVTLRIMVGWWWSCFWNSPLDQRAKGLAPLAAVELRGRAEAPRCGHPARSCCPRSAFR